MRPVSFDNCFGEFYPGWSRKGVVICGSFGLEDTRYQPALAHLAQVLAGRGLNVLRFDYFGTGNSAGTTLDPDIVRRWTGNVIAARDWLTKQGNVDAVSFAGLRMGALIAAMAARQSPKLDELILLAPPASGETFIAEISNAAGQEAGHLSSVNGDEQTGGVSLAGFRLDQRTIQAISDFDWQTLDRCKATKVKIMAENRIDDRIALLDAFTALGCDVSVQDEFKGFERALSDVRAARRNSPKWDAIAALVDVPPGSQGILPKSASVAPMAGPGYLETPVFLGSEETYSGLFCQSSGGLDNGMAVIILADATGYSLSWPRLGADLARRLARAGYSSVRLNDHYLADQETGAGPVQNTTSAGLTAAVDWLKAHRCKFITLLGTTATDATTLQLAGTDPRLSQLLLLDQPPLPLGKTTPAASVRSSDEDSAMAGETDELAARMRAARTSLQSLQRIADLASDKRARIEPLEQRLATVRASAKPLLLVCCEGAEKSPVLVGFNAGKSAAVSGPVSIQAGGGALHAVPSRDATFSEDQARNGFGDALIGFLENRMQQEKQGYRLALRPV